MSKNNLKKRGVKAKIAYCVMSVSMSIIILSSLASAQEGAAKSALKITIDVFSGRPNPIFYVDDVITINDIRETLVRMTVNAQFTKGSVMPSRLGYRGLIIENPGNISSIPKTTKLYGRNIEIESDKNRFFIDDGELELLLIGEAIERGVIDDAIADHILSEIE